MATSGKIKGSVLLSRVAFVRERLGEEGVRRVLASLPADSRAIFQGMILPSAWFPFSANEDIDDAIAREVQEGEAVFRWLGEKSASENLGSAHRVYVKDKDPHGLLKNAASIYKLYYDTGYRTYEKNAERQATLRTFESTTFSKADCLTVVGWHEKAIELCGGKNPKVRETKCRAMRADCCEYVCSWD